MRTKGYIQIYLCFIRTYMESPKAILYDILNFHLFERQSPNVWRLGWIGVRTARLDQVAVRILEHKVRSPKWVAGNQVHKPSPLPAAS